MWLHPSSPNHHWSETSLVLPFIGPKHHWSENLFFKKTVIGITGSKHQWSETSMVRNINGPKNDVIHWGWMLDICSLDSCSPVNCSLDTCSPPYAKFSSVHETMKSSTEVHRYTISRFTIYVIYAAIISDKIVEWILLKFVKFVMSQWWMYKKAMGGGGSNLTFF